MVDRHGFSGGVETGRVVDGKPCIGGLWWRFSAVAGGGGTSAWLRVERGKMGKYATNPVSNPYQTIPNSTNPSVDLQKHGKRQYD